MEKTTSKEHEIGGKRLGGKKFWKKMISKKMERKRKDDKTHWGVGEIRNCTGVHGTEKKKRGRGGRIEAKNSSRF